MRSNIVVSKKYENFRYFLENIRDFFSKSSSTIHKARNELRVIRHDETDVVVKAFKVPNPLNRLIYSKFRASKARKSYENAMTLERLGITTPEAIGYVEFYNSIFFGESFFVSKKFDYDFTIREPLLDKNFPDRDNIFKAFAAFTLMLHNKGVYHKDYSPGNILIKKLEVGYEFCLVDINRMEFKQLSTETRLANFAKLWIDDEDLSFVIKEYAKLTIEDEAGLISQAIRISNNYKNSKEARRSLKKKLFGR